MGGREGPPIDLASAWAGRANAIGAAGMRFWLPVAGTYGKRGRSCADDGGGALMTKFSDLAALAALAALVVTLTASNPSLAQPANLEGSWSGGGVVSFASG